MDLLKPHGSLPLISYQPILSYSLHTAAEAGSVSFDWTCYCLKWIQESVTKNEYCIGQLATTDLWKSLHYTMFTIGILSFGFVSIFFIFLSTLSWQPVCDSSLLMMPYALSLSLIQMSSFVLFLYFFHTSRSRRLWEEHETLNLIPYAK